MSQQIERFLVVEDEVALRAAISWQIRNLYRTTRTIATPAIVCVSNTDQAREVISEAERNKAFFDVAIIDLRLPNPGSVNNDAGFEVVSFLERFKTRVIILSVRTDEAMQNQASKHDNIDTVMSKPWSSVDLADRIGNYFNQRANGNNEPRPAFIGRFKTAMVSGHDTNNFR